MEEKVNHNQNSNVEELIVAAKKGDPIVFNPLIRRSGKLLKEDAKEILSTAILAGHTQIAEFLIKNSDLDFEDILEVVESIKKTERDVYMFFLEKRFRPETNTFSHSLRRLTVEAAEFIPIQKEEQALADNETPQIVKEIVEILLGRLSKSAERVEAAKALGNLFSKNPEFVTENVVTELLTLLESDKDPDARAAIAKALGKLSSKIPGSVTENVVTELLTLLESDKDPDARAAIAKALGKLSSENPKIVSDIVAHLLELRKNYPADPEAPDDASKLATIAMSHLSSENLKNIDQRFFYTAYYLLDDANSDVRGAAARAVGNLFSENQRMDYCIFTSKVISCLRESFDGNDHPGVRGAAARALGNFGKDITTVTKILSTLLDCLESQHHPDVHAAVLEAIGNQASKDPEIATQKIVPALIQRLNNTDDPKILFAVVGALSNLSSKNPEIVTQKIVPALIQRLNNTDDPKLLLAVAGVLGNLSSKNPEIVTQEIVPALIGRLENQNNLEIFLAVVEVLGNLPSKNLEIVTTDTIVDNLLLTRPLTNDSKDVRSAIPRVLCKLFSENPMIIDKLIDRLDNCSDSKIRKILVIALGRGRMYPNVIPALKTRLNDSSPTVVKAAEEALMKLIISSREGRLRFEADYAKNRLLTDLDSYSSPISLFFARVAQFLAETFFNVLPFDRFVKKQALAKRLSDTLSGSSAKKANKVIETLVRDVTAPDTDDSTSLISDPQNTATSQASYNNPVFDNSLMRSGKLGSLISTNIKNRDKLVGTNKNQEMFQYLSYLKVQC